MLEISKANVTKIIEDILGVDDIKEDTDLINECGADSLDMITVVVSIEQEFNIELTSKIFDNLLFSKNITVNELYLIIKQYKEGIL